MPEPTGSQQLLVSAEAALVTAVTSWLPEGTPDERDRALTSFRDVIFDKTDVIFITAETSVNAYRLFTVANNRGKPLEQADLIRAYLLQLLSTAKDDVISRRVATAWNDLDTRAPARTNAALRAYYGSVMGVRAPKGDVFDAFAKDIFKHSQNDSLTRPRARALKTRVDADLRGSQHLRHDLRGRVALRGQVTKGQGLGSPGC